MVSTLTAVSSRPTLKVAMTAPVMTAAWITSDTKPTPIDFFRSLVRPDSINVSNMAGRPLPVPFQKLGRSPWPAREATAKIASRAQPEPPRRVTNSYD